MSDSLYEQWTRLSSETQAALARLGQRRNAAKTHARDLKKDRGRNSAELHVLGISAEYMVSRVLGVEMDTRVLPAGSERVGNLTYKGQSVMVICRQRDCYVDPGDMVADVIVLVAYRKIDNTTVEYRVVGWLSRAEFERKKTVRDFGYGPRDFVAADDLNPMSTLRYASAPLPKRTPEKEPEQLGLFASEVQR